ncbi:hypothetical protein CF327_g6227 [Tilletia walkeri]|uniref:TLC domain-containing protein n=1 Tax=Tilletia walkeri TaxID=117179 RepID=A0A8X7N5J9_9BASI|nr:hypothetical protein CF327_g6227 [Tilletia walkeri]KAE8266989.1 hypothetical protein A4X09_0g5358 [Tilletia walkeri]
MPDATSFNDLIHAHPIYASMDAATIERLSSMLNEKVLPLTPYFYHSATFILFVLLWVTTLGISQALARIFGPRYSKLNFDQRRTTDIYVLNVILTTVAAGLQFAALSAFSMRFYSYHFNLLRLASMLVSANYCFELIYRPRMRLPMIAHHLLTLFLAMLSLSTLYKTKDPSIMLSGNMLMFLATLEQPTFLALFFYRLRFPRNFVKTWLQVSSFQTIITKSLAALGAVICWLKWQDKDRSGTATAYDALFWTSICGLYVTQWYGAIVTWRISKTIAERYVEHSTKSSTKEEAEAIDMPDIEVLNASSPGSPEESIAPYTSRRPSHSSRSSFNVKS